VQEGSLPIAASSKLQPGADPRLTALFEDANLLHLLFKFEKMNVYRIDDLNYLEKQDIYELGVGTVDKRKIDQLMTRLKISAWVTASAPARRTNSASPSAGSPSTTCAALPATGDSLIESQKAKSRIELQEAQYRIESQKTQEAQSHEALPASNVSQESEKEREQANPTALPSDGSSEVLKVMMGVKEDEEAMSAATKCNTTQIQGEAARGIYIHTYKCVYIYIYIYIYLYVSTSLYICVSICLYTYTSVDIHINVYMQIMCMYRCIYTCI